VVLLITSDLAYGDKTVGTIPQNSAVMMSLKILTVK
jgi:FKBP-type peptidyl-prolyl cis-trans isomerase